MRKEDIRKIEEIVGEHFDIVSVLEARNYLEYTVEPMGDLERSFEKVHVELINLGYNAYLDVENGLLKLKIGWIGVPKSRDIKIPLLFAVTFVTVSFAGYLQISSYNQTLRYMNIRPPLTIPLGTLIYATLFITALLIHEMGHYIISRIKGVPVSLPYFIPATPPYGTFGALINMRSLPSRLTTLMEVGISGPLAGFIGALIVSMIGLQLSAEVPVEKLLSLPEQPPPVQYAPLVFTLIFQALKRVGGDVVVLLHPIGGAGMFLLFITFLNLLPAAQLDGGHVARGVFGEEGHRLLTWLTILALMLTPYFIFALIILFLTFIGGGRHPGSMNRLSKPGGSAYIFAALYLTLLLLCFPAPIEAVERLVIAFRNL